jgi:hypothetical protein
MKIFKIKKGYHYSNLIYKIPFLHLFKKTIKHTLYFNENVIYELNNGDQMDINKLFGISFGFHHKNSARFGWRWNTEKNKIEILAYIYVDGKRINEWDEDTLIAELEPYEVCEMKIKKENNYYIFNIYSDSTKKNYIKKLKCGKGKFWGYYLFPYFGGNQVAPHDIEINFIK